MPDNSNGFCSSKEYSVMGFGEVMLRLSPPGQERINNGRQFVKHAGGSELNVVSGIARLGSRTGLVSVLPDNVVGQYIRNRIRSYGVSDDYILSDTSKQNRLGIYYYEGGVFPRKPQVIYDRAHSSFTQINVEEILAKAAGKAACFHTSGISLALGDKPHKAANGLIQAFKQAGAKISFDVNYRAALWSEEKARQSIEAILPLVDILFISEETSRRMMGRTGTLEEIQRGYHEQYGISIIASTKRVVNSPRSHTFSSLLYAADNDRHYTEEPYANIEVVDRIGSGDAYISGVLFALTSGMDYQEAVAFGNAMSAVKNTVPGDLLATDRGEIQNVINDHRSDGPVSEMNR